MNLRNSGGQQHEEKRRKSIVPGVSWQVVAAALFGMIPPIVVVSISWGGFDSDLRAETEARKRFETRIEKQVENEIRVLHSRLSKLEDNINSWGRRTDQIYSWMKFSGQEDRGRYYTDEDVGG